MSKRCMLGFQLLFRLPIAYFESLKCSIIFNSSTMSPGHSIIIIINLYSILIFLFIPIPHCCARANNSTKAHKQRSMSLSCAPSSTFAILRQFHLNSIPKHPLRLYRFDSSSSVEQNASLSRTPQSRGFHRRRHRTPSCTWSALAPEDKNESLDGNHFFILLLTSRSQTPCKDIYRLVSSPEK